MTQTFFPILLLFSVLFFGTIWFLFKKIKELKSEDPKQDQSILMLQQQVSSLREVLDQRLGDSQKSIQMHFGQSVKIVQEVTEKLERLDATNRRVADFATQLQSLENILKNPKHRGILGEYFLETLLSNILAATQYKMQYAFSNGEMVDAAIFVRDKIIPIDAKFSLEKYNQLMGEPDKERRAEVEKAFKQDLKIRIDETSKYIRPKEGTTEFAFMFIPAEGVYANLLLYNVGAVNVSSRNLIEYAFSKHVVIVSPSSFFAYLQTVLHALRSFQIEESVKDVIKHVNELSRHLVNHDAHLKRLGANISTAVNTYNTAYKEFGKIDKDVLKITGENNSIEVEQLSTTDGEE